MTSLHPHSNALLKGILLIPLAFNPALQLQSFSYVTTTMSEINGQTTRTYSSPIDHQMGRYEYEVHLSPEYGTAES